MPLRIISWNCRRASAKHTLWSYFSELSPDIAVLQEVSAIPPSIRDAYDIRSATPPTRTGLKQRFQSAILVRGRIGEQVALRSDLEWANRELNHFAANLFAYRVIVGDSPEMTVVGVYVPAWPVARQRLEGENLSSVKLVQNPDVWVADLLVSALRQRTVDATEWVVGGDFNSCETFDSWRGGPRGNREWLDRMAALQFTECLRQSQGKLTPTFRRPGKTEPHCQIDHLFVTRGLAERLASCNTGDQQRVYGQTLSDHLPIVADFTDHVVRAASQSGA